MTATHNLHGTAAREYRAATLEGYRAELTARDAFGGNDRAEQAARILADALAAASTASAEHLEAHRLYVSTLESSRPDAPEFRHWQRRRRETRAAATLAELRLEAARELAAENA